MFNKYPFTNFHDINIDWIITKLKDLAGGIHNEVWGWLADHPEATTTVVDGSITEQKLGTSLKLRTIKEYVTPEMFGAVGDGETDDSDAIQRAFDTRNTVRFSKVYGVSKTVTAFGSCVMENGSAIKALTMLNPVLNIGDTSSQIINGYYHVVINCNGVAKLGIKVGYVKQSNLNLFVRNCGEVGIDTGNYGANNENVFTIGVQGNETSFSDVGIRIGNGDSFFNVINVYNCKYGVQLYDYATLHANEVHVWLSDRCINIDEVWNGSACVHIDTSSERICNIKWLYQDNIQYAILSQRRINAIIGVLSLNTSDLPSTHTIRGFKTINGLQCFIEYEEFRGTTDTIYPVFENMGNSSVYGCASRLRNLSVNNATATANFTDMNDAPSLGNWYLPYTIQNLPASSNSNGCSDVIGRLVIQTVYRGTEASYMYTRWRELGTDTWSEWRRINLT